MDEAEELEELSQAWIDALLRGLGLDPRPPRERPKTDWTVEELYEAVLPEPQWIVPELLPTGLASLAGRPKLGKSWLALQLAAAVAAGGSFLERPVKEGRVLFIALEDPPRRLRQRVKRLWVARGAPLQFYTTWPPLNQEQGRYELEQTVAEWKPRLVVIDTLARAYDRRMEWNSVSEATEAMGALQRLAHEHECCILTVDHHKKAGLVANVVDDLLGSTGKAAVVDTAWGLYKDRSRGNAILRVTGRDVDGCELALRFSGGGRCWEVRGTSPPWPPLLARGDAPGEGRVRVSAQGRVGEGRRSCPSVLARGEGGMRVSQQWRVAEALRELGGVATTSEIAERAEMAAGNVSHALAELVAAGWVRRLARVGHGVPYEWVGEGD